MCWDVLSEYKYYFIKVGSRKIACGTERVLWKLRHSRAKNSDRSSFASSSAIYTRRVVKYRAIFFQPSKLQVISCETDGVGKERGGKNNGSGSCSKQSWRGTFSWHNVSFSRPFRSRLVDGFVRKHNYRGGECRVTNWLSSITIAGRSLHYFPPPHLCPHDIPRLLGLGLFEFVPHFWSFQRFWRQAVVRQLSSGGHGSLLHRHSSVISTPAAAYPALKQAVLSRQRCLVGLRHGVSLGVG